jgi:signal transduction histidine kinase/Tfp pilus assembly protein PilF
MKMRLMMLMWLWVCWGALHAATRDDNEQWLAQVQDSLRANPQWSLQQLNNAEKTTGMAAVEHARVRYLGGMAHYYLHQYVAAESLLSRADTLFLQMNKHEEHGAVLNALGNLYYRQSNYQQSILYYHRALHIKRQIDPVSTIQPLNNLGLAYYYIGEYDRAFSSFQDALSLAEAAEDSLWMAHSLNGIARLHRQLEKPEDALNAYKQALAIYEALGDDYRVANTLNDIGMVYKQLDDYNTAIHYQRLSYTLKKQLGNRRGMANSLLGLGISYKKMGQLDQAEQYYADALTIQKELGDATGEAATLSNLGTLALQQGDLTKAEQLLQQSLVKAKAIAYRELQMNTYQALADLASTQQRYQDAYRYLGAYYALRDSVQGEQTEQRIAELDVQYQTRKKEQQIALLNEQKRSAEELVKYHRNQAVMLVAGVALVVALLISIITKYAALRRLNRQLQSANQQIASQKNTLELINRNQAELVVQLQQLNTQRSRLFSLISHDLKGAFASLKMGSEFLHHSLDELSGEEIGEIASELESTSGNLGTMLENLLAWSRMQLGKIECRCSVLNAFTLSENVQAIMQVKARHKDVQVVNEIASDLQIVADETMLASALQNVIANAIKFSNPGSQVTIRSQLQDGMASLIIQDAGVGMNSSELSAARQGGFSLPGTAREKGTGLGLMLTREFIELQGGSMKISSTKGRGTTVVLTLPAA